LRKLNYESITFLVREGPLNVSKSIPHTHFHIIPQILIGDVDHLGQERRVLEADEIENVVREIRAVIRNE